MNDMALCPDVAMSILARTNGIPSNESAAAITNDWRKQFSNKLQVRQFIVTHRGRYTNKLRAGAAFMGILAVEPPLGTRTSL
jgi:hypothetical protein